MSTRTYSAGIVTAYGSAVQGGYTGTYEQFSTALGQLADVLADLEGLAVNVTTLEEGASATASYSDGVITLGIPRGNTGNGIASAVLNADYTLTLTFTDGNSYTTPSIRGEVGAKGDKGNKGDKGDTGNGIASIAKTATAGLVDTYTITYTDGTTFSFEVTNGQDGEVTEESLAETLEDYAKIDGYYEEMTVGDAEQLVATQYVEDNVPYQFRTTGGSADVGNREYVDEIVGGTVAWNQHAENATDAWITSGACTKGTYDSDTRKMPATFTGSSGRLRLKLTTLTNHVYLTIAKVKSSVAGTASIEYLKGYLVGSKSVSADTETEIYALKQVTSTNDASDAQFYIVNESSYTLEVRDCNSFDLTQMFGSTIADYIYSLEQATAGAGVAWFKKLFPKDYYEYNAGELIHVNASEHKTVGFNTYNPTTGIAKLLGGNQYQITGTYTAVSYSTGETLTIDSDGYFTPSANGTLTVTGGNNTDTCVHLVWSGYRNGEYEEYSEHSYPLDDSLVLRGIPKLDASNNLYYDGDTYESDGTVTRKYGIVDLGTLTWYAGATGTSGIYRMRTPSLASLIKPSADNVCGNLICSKYKTDTANGSYLLRNSIAVGANGNIFVYDENYNTNTSASAFKTAMSGVYLVYELATPTTEEAEPYQQIQICDDFGTEEFVSTSIVPVGHNTRYPANLRDKLQHLPDLTSADGTYAIQQSGSQMSLVHLPSAIEELPDAPTTDGNYVLKATVTSGVATYEWGAVE